METDVLLRAAKPGTAAAGPARAGQGGAWGRLGGMPRKAYQNRRAERRGNAGCAAV